MTDGWIDCATEPPHRSDANEDLFRETCAGCPHQIESDLEPISGRSYVRCAVCTCPLKIVVHRYGCCPVKKIPPPEIP